MTVLQEAQSIPSRLETHRVSDAGTAHAQASHTWAAHARAESTDPKRLLDIAGASLALIFCAPVMLLVYLPLCMMGRPIFKQRRVGRGGKLFFCYKFRTMVHDADRVMAEHLRRNHAAREEWSRAYKLADDPRVTWFGRVLRRTSLDELPQLFNVLKGDMSLVGPRPIVPDEVRLYAGRIGSYYKFRPGITGLWQTNGRNLVTYERRVALDTLYARKWTLGLDARILVKTVWVVLSGKGAC